MKKWQRDVRAFHRHLGLSAPDSLTMPTAELLYIRRRLVAEECNELVDALGEADLAKVAGECVDVLYVVLGTAVSLGIDLAPHWRAVHRANMRKEMPPEGGKARKPRGWRAPDHAAILTRSLAGRRWWNPRSWFRN